MDIHIQLTSAGVDADNFTLAYYLTPGPYVDFATFVSRVTLLAGVDFTIPDGSTLVKITSTGVCINDIIITINTIATTSSSSTTTTNITSSTSSTTSTSTTHVYYNVELNQWFQRDDCPDGPTYGDWVLYTVPAGTYSSTISQLIANALAQDEIDANGQGYANSTGGCEVVPPTTTTTTSTTSTSTSITTSTSSSTTSTTTTGIGSYGWYSVINPCPYTGTSYVVVYPNETDIDYTGVLYPQLTNGVDYYIVVSSFAVLGYNVWGFAEVSGLTQVPGADGCPEGTTSTSTTTTDIPVYGHQIRLANDPTSICTNSVFMASSTSGAWAEGMVLYTDGTLTVPVSGTYIVQDCITDCPVYNLIDGVLGSITGYTCYVSTSTTTSTTTTIP